MLGLLQKLKAVKQNIISLDVKCLSCTCGIKGCLKRGLAHGLYLAFSVGGGALEPSLESIIMGE